jgi:uncharacterized protein (DUF4415 family)
MKRSTKFSRGKRGAVVTPRGKTRITIYLDDAIIDHFRAVSEQTGKGYQTLINDALAAHMTEADKPLTATAMRRILREELSERRTGG